MSRTLGVLTQSLELGWIDQVTGPRNSKNARALAESGTSSTFFGLDFRQRWQALVQGLGTIEPVGDEAGRDADASLSKGSANVPRGATSGEQPRQPSVENSNARRTLAANLMSPLRDGPQVPVVLGGTRNDSRPATPGRSRSISASDRSARKQSADGISQRPGSARSSIGLEVNIPGPVAQSLVVAAETTPVFDSLNPGRGFLKEHSSETEPPDRATRQTFKFDGVRTSIPLETNGSRERSVDSNQSFSSVADAGSDANTARSVANAAMSPDLTLSPTTSDAGDRDQTDSVSYAPSSASSQTQNTTSLQIPNHDPLLLAVPHALDSKSIPESSTAPGPLLSLNMAEVSSSKSYRTDRPSLISEERARQSGLKTNLKSWQVNLENHGRPLPVQDSTRAIPPSLSPLAATEPFMHENASGPARAVPNTSREAFEALDTGLIAPSSRWVHLSDRRAEAGFHDPEIGWVSVRAQVDANGVHATLVPSSTGAAQILGKDLAGLNTHIAAQYAHVNPVALSPPETRSISHNSGGEMGQGEQGSSRRGSDQAAQNDHHSSQRTRESETFTTISSARSMSRRELPLTLNENVSEGSFVSVLA